MSFRKNALQLLRDILQGYAGEKDLLVPSLIDEVSSIMIQFRCKLCLDCMIGGYGRNELEVVTPCTICREPLCETCLLSIEKVTHTMKEKEVQEAKGRNLVQMICSYCREFGTLKVSRGLLDDIQDTTGANIGAFKVLQKFTEGVSPLPF